eukprot:365788-Chlamydomonas_euryale.AAC.3
MTSRPWLQNCIAAPPPALTSLSLGEGLCQAGQTTGEDRHLNKIYIPILLLSYTGAEYGCHTAELTRLTGIWNAALDFGDASTLGRCMVELDDFVHHVFVNVDDGSLVAAAVAVVWRTEDGHHRALVLPQEAF